MKQGYENIALVFSPKAHTSDIAKPGAIAECGIGMHHQKIWGDDFVGNVIQLHRALNV